MGQLPLLSSRYSSELRAHGGEEQCVFNLFNGIKLICLCLLTLPPLPLISEPLAWFPSALAGVWYRRETDSLRIQQMPVAGEQQETLLAPSPQWETLLVTHCISPVWTL